MELLQNHHMAYGKCVFLSLTTCGYKPPQIIAFTKSALSEYALNMGSFGLLEEMKPRP